MSKAAGPPDDERPRYDHERKYRSKAWLVTHYVEGDATVADLAEMADCSRGTIYDWLDYYDIPRERYRSPAHMLDGLSPEDVGLSPIPPAPGEDEDEGDDP